MWRKINTTVCSLLGLFSDQLLRVLLLLLKLNCMQFCCYLLIVYCCQVHAFLGEVFIIYGNIFYVSHLYIIMASMFSRLFSANRVAERFTSSMKKKLLI